MDTPRSNTRVSAIDRWSGPATWFVLSVGFVLRVTNLSLLPPFLDETSGLKAALDYEIHPVMERLFLGKYFGYLLQRPVIELANDPVWAGRALSGVFGFLAALIASQVARRLGGGRAGLVCAILMALTPQLVFHDRLALPESFTVFFASLSCLLWLIGRRNERSGLTLLAGVSAACACATKIYTAPIFLLIPVLASESSGGWRKFFRHELRLLVLGFFGAVLLILLSALDQTWAQHLSMADLLRMPLMIAGDGAGNVPSLGTRLSNAAGLFSDYLPATFWLLLASAFIAGRRVSKQGIACLVLAALIFVLYTGVFRTFVAARYFDVLWLPIAVGISVCLVSPFSVDHVSSKLRRVWAPVIQLGLVAIVAGQFVWRDTLLLVKPEAFPLPHADYFQYFSGWPSGRGLENVSAYLRARSLESDKPVLVITLMGFRHGNTSVPVLLRNDPHIRFITAWEGNDYVVSQLPGWLRANIVLVLVEPMGTPVDFKRTEAAGFHATKVFSAPDFEGAPGYGIFQFGHNP